MILETIARMARDQPGKIAAVQGPRSYSYATFARWIGAVGSHLEKQNLPTQGVAAICVNRLLDAWVLGLALRSLGLTTVVVRNAGHLRQLQLTDVMGVFGITTDGRTQLPAHVAALSLRLVLVPGGLDRAAADGPLPDLKPASGGNIMATSGTTGRSKKVLRDAAAESLLIPLHARINFIDEHSVIYVANFGQWLAGGYRWPLIAWSAGATVIFHQGKNEHRPLQRHEVTHVFTTPQLLMQLLEKPAEALRRNDAMHVLVTAGAMSKSQAMAARQRLSRRLYSVLASSEALTLAVTPIESGDDLHYHRIHPEREAQVVDTAGQPLPHGKMGLVRVRILDGLTGYLNDEAATRAFFKDGWFYPGDLGVMHEDGRLSLHGRTGDVINLLGNKIATAPVEAALQDRLGLDGVCLLSLRPDGGDEEMHVIYEGSDRVKAAAWHAAIARELPLLGSVNFHIERVKKMPRNEMGKIRRLLLKRHLQTRIGKTR